MPKASVNQTSFLGGEWGPYAQGRSDDAKYSTALTLCLNGYPVEEGAWTARAGTEFICPAHGGFYPKLLSFDGSETCSFAMEFTSPPGAANGILRFLTQSGLVCTNDAQTIIVASANQFTLSGNPSWSAGDEVLVVFPDATSSLYPFPLSDELNLRNQICTIGTITPGTNAVISLVGFFTGAVATTASTNLVGAQLLHVKQLTTPYTGGPVQLQTLRAIQAEIDSIILCPTVAPQVVQITTQGTLIADPVFTFSALSMIDGPYQNPQGNSLSLSAITGTVTATAGSATFAATDVGRSMRIFTQPAAWASGTTYAAGNNVTDASGAWWTSLISSNTGNPPGQAATVNGVQTVVWAPAPTAGSWAWGKITAFTDSTHVTFAFDTTIPGMALQTANGTAATTWQLGVFSNTTGWPSCGVFYEGRLFLSGAIPNRFDTTVSNGVSQVIGTNSATFSPTDPYGNVLDNSGISLVMNSRGINQIQWMIGDAGGVLAGTLAGETLIAASQLGDPITPTSIQAHEITKYGSLNIDARRAGMAVVFAQKNGRRVMEYLDDAFSSKFSGRHLNEMAKHMTVSGIARLEYSEEPVPLVWALMNNGLLTGCTYRRFSRFVQTPPECQGWHWNMHGGNRVFTDMCTVPGKNGLVDRLFLATNPPATTAPNAPAPSQYYIEIMQPIFDPSLSLLQAWQLDQAPGIGPGNSGFDCGGGNSASFSQTGGIKGADSVAAPGSPSTQLTAFQTITPGQSPPAGGTLLLANQQAAFFPGTVILYGLPKAALDKTSLSMSVWLGINDFPSGQGALLSSPELKFSELGTGITSSLVGGSTAFGLNSALAYTGSNNVLIGSSTSSASYPAGGAFVQGEIQTTGNTQWVHLMVSAKSNGDGNISVLAYCNDTLCVNTTTTGAKVGSTGDMWPFVSQIDQQKDNGMAVWGIGGAFVTSPVYNITVNQVAGPPQTVVVPPLVNLLGANLAQELILESQGKHLTGQYAGLDIRVPGFVAMNPNPTPQQLYDAIFKGYSYAVNTIISTAIGDGGPTNFPVPTSMEQATGYIGSVAEMWVIAGTYVDWTVAGTRNKFHEFDSVTESWGPLPLGTNGTVSGVGAPLIYLSGGPEFFPLNNANGKWLTELDTTSGLINFQTGLGGGLQQSPLSFP